MSIKVFFDLVNGGNKLDIRIETRCEYEYEEINKLYGIVLNNFCFRKVNEYAYITLNSMEDIEKLDNMLDEYINNYEGYNGYINWYFGILFKHDLGEFILEIKDNFD